MIAEVMPLAAILDRIDDISNDLTIYVADSGQLSSTTNAVALPEQTGHAAPSGMRYLLEGSLAREAIKVWSDWRGGRAASSDDKASAVIYYAGHDACMPAE